MSIKSLECYFLKKFNKIEDLLDYFKTTIVARTDSVSQNVHQVYACEYQEVRINQKRSNLIGIVNKAETSELEEVHRRKLSSKLSTLLYLKGENYAEINSKLRPEVFLNRFSFGELRMLRSPTLHKKLYFSHLVSPVNQVKIFPLSRQHMDKFYKLGDTFTLNVKYLYFQGGRRLKLYDKVKTNIIYKNFQTYICTKFLGYFYSLH